MHCKRKTNKVLRNLNGKRERYQKNINEYGAPDLTNHRIQTWQKRRLIKINEQKMRKHNKLYTYNEMITI